MNNQQHQEGQGKDKHHENEHADPSQGQQGIDKIPGEETTQENVQFSQDAFKGKKVDADPSEESDTPADQPSI
jgi:hypothetical protein